jgi:3-phenylpropionate/cinnamic acid dioxygenase small subunit
MARDDDPVTYALRHEFESLLVDEYWLLDTDRFEDWLDVMAADLRYWSPVREDLDRGEEDFTRPHLLTHFDEDLATMGLRVARLRTGSAHAEEPPSRVRHFVANVKVLDHAESSRVRVASNFMVFRSRSGREETLFVGTRRDWWRREQGAWKLVERMIVFDHDIIDNITVFF